MIWVKPDDKQAILHNIEKHKWKKDYYQAFVNRVQADVAAYYENPKQYLSGLPFDLSAQKPGQIPPFFYINNPDKEAAYRRNKLQHYLKNAIDCSIIYFLTNDEKYVKYSTSVFYTFLKSMLQLKASETPFNGGLIYQDDHLRESREVGAQMPVLYDFIYPYISKGGKGYNFVTDTYETVSVTEAETIFRTYVNLALGRGIVDCNWPVLESSSLVCNTLALNSESERNYFLQYYLTRDTTHQDALAKVAAVYKKEINWPESLNYSSGVAKLSTYLMTLLTKLDSSLHLGRKYPEILSAVTLPYYLTYPNNTQQILFGDGGRSYRHPIVNYELAYFLGKLENSSSIQNEFGSLLNTALQEPAYNRSQLNPRSYIPEPYFEEPLKLLWYCPEIVGEVKTYPKPVTVELPFAGILLQRNLSSSANPKHGLMTFVGGGAFIHGHASGMNMELYGQGHVLGTKAGKGSYTTEIHENYYRLFASHNTIVVNGYSRGEGGWVNLAINTVNKVAMEPLAYKKPVSGNYSFTISGFIDDKGDSAEAKQERTVGIIRTSTATGYYVDIFRSESKLPNQYHDYIYHNIGDSLIFNTSDQDFVLQSDEDRYKFKGPEKWGRERKFMNPGWHYFNTVETSNKYEKDLEVLFEANALGKQPVKMKLFVTADKNREYTKALAPPSVESVKAYSDKQTPTLVIRKKGEAWRNPFVVVYESFAGTSNEGQIKSVESILQNGIFKGVIVNSIVNGKAIKQMIISQDNDDSIFEDKALQIKFKGRYAVLTLNAKSQLAELYIGNGTQFSYQKWSVTAADAKAVSLSLTISGKNGNSNANGKFKISYPEGFKLTETIINND
ncbi:heparinase II/III domain-containing protein [Lacibacter sediminis]|uniref:Heparinase II/III family protein n=1 Tax=Lacibacter sediminis TaxID=2760713 RepID=A0A7G5XDA8_9BACT|nr:heparinase II/III family protein [Lacibacter sediminis]QNA43461.1 heparinase II/III family protein [Lacibacter sediminis]